MKKNQKDFQKVKLRVGKHLPKGRNETKTSFQTKKIHLKKQMKQTADEPTLKELLSFMKSTDVKIKFDNLRRLSKYVSNNKETLPMFFPDILKELGRTLQESESKIRSGAISVLSTCAKILTDTQFKSFVVPLVSYLNCMMTHISLPVKRDSLKFLDILLNSHCSVICQSHEILFNLLNMISCKNSFEKNMSSNEAGRRLFEIINTKIPADDWRKEVLQQMLTFLDGNLLIKDSMTMDINDEKKVYWDAKKALFLPLYLNSGVKPAEFDYSLYCSVNSEAYYSEDFKAFINDLVCILSAILKSITIRKCNYKSVTLYLLIITGVLRSIAELVFKNPDLGNNSNIVEGLVDNCCQLMKYFPYMVLPNEVPELEVQCQEMNLCIGYLYFFCRFFNENTFETYDAVLSCIKEMFKSTAATARVNEKSISLLLKISRILLLCKTPDEKMAQDSINVCFLALLDLEKPMTPMIINIYSFLMDWSFDYANKDLQCRSSREWFQNVLQYLSFMVKSNMIVPNFLNYIKQVCARRITTFMDVINSFQPYVFINYLEHEDEDYQLTIIHLIVSLDNISEDLLQSLAKIMRKDHIFSLKTTCILIRLLHTRFSKPVVRSANKIQFMTFLLNVGCDTSLILDPSQDKDPLPLTDMLISFQQSFACPREIYPTSNFEERLEIFKVCADCLPVYLKENSHLNFTRIFIKTIFSGHVRYPLHSVVAVIKLFKRFSILINDMNSTDFLQNFVYSCLLYNSLITKDFPEVHWNEYCVGAVQDCLDIVNALNIIVLMNNSIRNIKKDHLLHIFRILKFLMQSGHLDVVDRNYIVLFLNKLSNLDAFHAKPEFEIMLRDIYDYLTNEMC